jgi:hypothetical protein
MLDRLVNIYMGGVSREQMHELISALACEKFKQRNL